MRVKTRRHKTQKLLEKLPVAGSPCTPCRASKGEKSDESQFPIRDSVESKRPPAHALVGTAIGHLPRTETNHAPVVTLFVDEKMLRGAEDLVDSFVAVFADVGNTFKGGKDFSDHIFYWLRLSGNKVAVKDKNITVTVRNDFRRKKTFLDSFFGNADESGGESFASMGEV